MNDTKWTLIRLMRMAVGCEPYEPMTLPKPLLMEWTLKAEAIRGFNAKMNAEAARLTRWFGERGRKTAILKGQANARLYPHPEERQPGDIDIWVVRFIRTIPKRIKYRRLSLLYFHEE